MFLLVVLRSIWGGAEYTRVAVTAPRHGASGSGRYFECLAT
jgi:hypothetical protein